MKNLTLVIMLAAMLTLSSGCSYWYQQGKSFDEAEMAKSDCLAQLGQRSEMRTIETYEIQYMNECMSAKGYEMKMSNNLPTQTRRQLPELSKYWLAKGTAGDVDENYKPPCGCR